MAHLVGLALVGLVLLGTAASAGLTAIRRPVMEPAIAELLDRVNEVLDSTAAFPGRSAAAAPAIQAPAIQATAIHWRSRASSRWPALTGAAGHG
jgi:hypothetical protein